MGGTLIAEHMGLEEIASFLYGDLRNVGNVLLGYNVLLELELILF